MEFFAEEFEVFVFSAELAFTECLCVFGAEPCGDEFYVFSADHTAGIIGRSIFNAVDVFLPLMVYFQTVTFGNLLNDICLHHFSTV